MHTVQDLANDAVSSLFLAVAEASEEAIYNSLLRATTVRGHKRSAEALPIDKTVEILKRYNVLDWDKKLPPRARR